MTNPPAARKMKVCILTSCYPTHYEDRQASDLRMAVGRLSERNDVTVAAPTRGGTASAIIDGVRVLRFQYTRAPLEESELFDDHELEGKKPMSAWTTVRYLLAGYIFLIYHLLRERFDVVDLHGIYPNALFALAPIIFRVRFILTCDGPSSRLADQPRWLRPLLGWLVRSADDCVCLDGAGADEVMSLAGRGARIIPHGIDVSIDATESDLTEPKLDSPAKLLFTCSGRETTGLPFLLRAIPQILTQRPVRLAVVGDRSRWLGCRALLYSMGLHDSVQFLEPGDGTEIEGIYDSCSIYVHSVSPHENAPSGTLPVGLIAAMLSGRPVITTTSGGRDLIEDQVTGVVVADRSESALAAAVLSLLASPETASRLARAGRQFARHYFDWTHVTEQTESVYRGGEPDALIPAGETPDEQPAVLPVAHLPRPGFTERESPVSPFDLIMADGRGHL